MSSMLVLLLVDLLGTGIVVSGTGFANRPDLLGGILERCSLERLEVIRV